MYAGSSDFLANLIRKAEIRVLPAVIVVDDKVGGVFCCAVCFHPSEHKHFAMG